MITYKSFLTEQHFILLEDTHMKTHLSHLEDLAIEQGKSGYDNFLVHINEITKKLQGFETEQQINAKIDGSPMVLFGTDPRPEFTGQFFISTKSGLSQITPKIAHNNAEIQQYYGAVPELANRLKALLIALKGAYDGTGKIYQGDTLYASAQDKKITKIGDESFIVFKPNVIVYAVPVDPESELSRLVQDSTVGVIVHEAFRGIPTNDGKAIKLQSAGRNIQSLIDSSKSSDAFIQSSNYGTLTIDVPEKYFADINFYVSGAKNYIDNISNEFNSKYVNSDIMQLLKIFLNKQVDLGDQGFFGTVSEDEDLMLEEFITSFKQFLQSRYNVEVEKKKTARGKASITEKLNHMLNFLESQHDSLKNLLAATLYMLKTKNILLKIFANLDSKIGKTFIQNPDGTFVKTKDEGYVLFVGTNHVKIVDRLDFTKTNRQFGGKKRAAIIA